MLKLYIFEYIIELKKSQFLFMFLKTYSSWPFMVDLDYVLNLRL